MLPSTKIVPVNDDHIGQRECPLCGGTMRIRVVSHVVQIPGNPNATTRNEREWVCPDCDFFEESEEEA